MTERITESAAARELRAGFRQLRFEPALEAEFRTTRLMTARRQIRYNLLLAAALIAAFAVMDRWLLGDSSQLVARAQTAYARIVLKGTPNDGIPVLSAAAPFKAGGRGGPT